MGIIYYNTPPTNAQLGDTWWDTSVSPAVERLCVNTSPLTFSLVAQQKTTITRFVPTTGGTIAIPNTIGDQVIIIAPANDLATLTISWPSTSYDGQAIRILSTKNVAAISHSGGTLNRSINSTMAGGDMNFVYDLGGATYMCDGATLSSIVSLPFTGTVTTGNCVIFITDSGLVGGNALFVSIQNIQPSFDVANPNDAFSKPVVSNSNKTLTTNCQRQTFTGVTVVGINVLGSVGLGNTPNGTALSFLVHGILA